MTIALVSRGIKMGGVGATVVADAINATGANLLLAFVASYQAASQTITDSAGNVYIGLTERLFLTTDRRARLFYCLNPTVSSNLVITSTGGGFASIAVAAFSGVKTSGALDQEIGGGITNVGFFPGLITPPQDGCLFVAGICTSSEPVNMAISLGYDLQWLPGGSGMGIGFAYKIQTTAAAQNPSFTWTNAGGIAALHTSFLPQPDAVPGGAGFSKSGLYIGVGL